MGRVLILGGAGLVLALAGASCNSLTGVNDLVVNERGDTASNGGASADDFTAMGGDSGAGASAASGGQGGRDESGGSSGAGPAQGGMLGLGGSNAVASNTPCNLVTAAECPPGETCGFDDVLRAAVCRLLPATPAEPYGYCTSDADCGDVQSCLGGVCNLHCNTAEDCPWAGALCVPVTAAPPLAFCTRNCDPLTTGAPRAGLQGCGAGARCFSIDSEGYTDCLGTEDIPVVPDGAECLDDSECQVGALCMSLGGVSRCRRGCDMNAPACAAGVICEPRINVAGIALGYCDDRLCDPVEPATVDATFKPCAPGQYCVPGVNFAESSCVPALDTLSANEPCDNHALCAPGLACFNGVCRQWCRPGTGCPITSEGDSCELALFTVGPNPVPLTFQTSLGDPIGICGTCTDTCATSFDLVCDDETTCAFGTDCNDCGIR